MSPDELRHYLLTLFRQEHGEHIGALRRILATAEDENRPFTTAEWEEVLRRFHTLKGAARAVDLPRLESLAHETETWLGRFDWKESSASTIAEALRHALDASEDYLDDLSTGDKPQDALPESAGEQGAVSPQEAALAHEEAALSSAPTVRVSAPILDDLLAQSEQLLLEVERQREITSALAAVERRTPLSGPSGNGAPALRKEIGSLRRTQRQAAWRLQQITARMQESVRAVRFVPAETVTAGFGTMLRDLARDTGREVDFRIVGGDTMADRQVLQALRDSLLHMLRNTISHGIEPAGERLAAGKPRAGQVTLRFDLDGARLRVTVDDDGRGLDRDRIARTAVDRGLIGEEEAARAGIERLIFASGFSTTETADRISGRGMGLSVVAQIVTRLHGEVSVAQKSEPGARIVVTVPLSLSLQRLLLACVGERRFGIPVQAVERLHRVRIEDLETAGGAPYVRLENDAPVRLVHLAGLVGLPIAPDGDMLAVAVLRLGERRIALATDRFQSEMTTAVKEPGVYLRGVRLVDGSFLLPGGAVGLTLDVPELFQRAVSAPLPALPDHEARSAPGRILVVDDSITTRTLERSILEARGYRVRVAVDGAEALALLLEGTGSEESIVDVVVADVEMPRMNGFELLEALKKTERLASLPVILVTSRDSDEDRERGLSLGADAYIVKRQFDQRHLLETIEQLLP